MRVAVAVITDECQRILITRRGPHASHGGMWEFPGGKLENEELASQALVREVKEEVDLDVLAYDYLGEVRHTYPHQVVSLLVYHVHCYQGEAVCREMQMDLRWVDLSSLNEFQFPKANIEIIGLIHQNGFANSSIRHSTPASFLLKHE